jgi:histone-lysine N-methyltransferase SETD3
MSQDPIDRMIAWLVASGAECGRFGVDRRDERERGAYALAPISKGDVILRIPRRYIINDEVVNASAIGKKIAASGARLRSAYSPMAAYLLEARRDERSFYRPYIETLPVSYRHMPIFFREQELSLLKGSYTLKMIDNRWESLMSDYHSLRHQVPGFDAFTTHDFVWARLTVGTRTFSLSTEGEGAAGLVPLVDMMNYRYPHETSWNYEDDEEAFVLKALQGFAPGDPMHTNYGRRCNGSFFVNYGFVLDENDRNEAALELSVPAGDPLFEMKRAALEPWGVTRTFRVPADHLKAAPKMFSFLRFALANAGELAPLTARGDLKVEEIGPISARNEEAVLRALGAAAEAALSRFDTTIEQDNAILRNVGLPSIIRRCVVQRRGEKRVLRHYLRLAAAVPPLLRLSRDEIDRAIAADPGTAELSRYLKKVVIPLAERAARGPKPPR